MERADFPTEVIEKIRDGIDCNVYFFGEKVGVPTMYGILCGAIVLLLGLYVLMNILRGRKKR